MSAGGFLALTVFAALLGTIVESYALGLICFPSELSGGPGPARPHDDKDVHEFLVELHARKVKRRLAWARLLMDDLLSVVIAIFLIANGASDRDSILTILASVAYSAATLVAHTFRKMKKALDDKVTCWWCAFWWCVHCGHEQTHTHARSVRRVLSSRRRPRTQRKQGNGSPVASAATCIAARNSPPSAAPAPPSAPAARVVRVSTLRPAASARSSSTKTARMMTSSARDVGGAGRVGRGKY